MNKQKNIQKYILVNDSGLFSNMTKKEMHYGICPFTVHTL